jgi:hypothetical protein
MSDRGASSAFIGGACALICMFYGGLALAGFGGFVTCAQSVIDQRPEGIYVGMIVVGLELIIGAAVWCAVKKMKH